MDKLFKSLESIGAEIEDTLDRFMGDKEMYLKYIKSFPQEKNMDTLINAMENKDYKQAEKSAHALKGIALNLGFLPLSDVAMEMLIALRNNDLEDALENYEELKTQYSIFCDVIRKNCN